MEFMDRRCIEAVEATTRRAIRGAEGVLIIDADGMEAEVDHAIARIADIARGCGAQVREATEKASAPLLGRAQGGVSRDGRLAPDMLCMDGTIPRHALPQVLARWPRCRRNTARLLQRVPCRRRQPASADHLRRDEAGRARRAPRRSAPISCACASRSAAC
jgi:FAD/FMN-containing dehydrogenase